MEFNTYANKELINTFCNNWKFKKIVSNIPHKMIFELEDNSGQYDIIYYHIIYNDKSEGSSKLDYVFTKKIMNKEYKELHLKDIRKLANINETPFYLS